MLLTKHRHACVELDGLLIDPGAFTPNRSTLVARATAVLITHDHVDHLDADLLGAALRDRPDLHVWGPAAAVERWSDTHPDRVHVVGPGDRFDVHGVDVSVHGGHHALIHADIPPSSNVGYLVAGSVYHPGDSLVVPDADVQTLLLPVSGPWTKVGEVADFARAVAPALVVPIHEAMLSDLGLASTVRFLGPDVLGTVAPIVLTEGESRELL